MSVRTFGIYLAYAPGLDLRHEGLGRYLAAFLKGAAKRQDVRFVLLCPSWSKKDLNTLFLGEGVPQDALEIVAPANVPAILKVYNLYSDWKKRTKRKGLKERFRDKVLVLKERFLNHLENRLVAAESYLGLLTLGLEALLVLGALVLLSPLLLVTALALLLARLRSPVRRLLRPLKRALSRLGVALGSPKDDAMVQRLYRRLEQLEAQRMLSKVAGRHDIKAWYSPTAFWPAFNDIAAPRLMCVPDVVLSDFPVGFSGVGGDRFMQVFDRVECAIRTGEHFVTYSDSVKWDTLVARYGVPASNVNVINHAPNDLSRWIEIEGFDQSEETSHNYCRTLLLRAFKKSSNYSYARSFKNADVRFMFYASQFRPNKNVITLLKAYEYLLRNRYLGHKLVMTGHIEGLPEIKQFIRHHGLENDVICLHGLSVQELAACYKLADLAVNPSLSEGGCPFTFTEALSVETPVLMARIGVTEEVIADPSVQAVTLFDPYDWRKMADKIEWGLNNLDEMHAVQKPLYDNFAQRTWTDVVNEHIEVLERISTETRH